MQPCQPCLGGNSQRPGGRTQVGSSSGALPTLGYRLRIPDGLTDISSGEGQHSTPELRSRAASAPAFHDYRVLLQRRREGGSSVVVLPLVTLAGQHGVAACGSRSDWRLGCCRRASGPVAGALGVTARASGASPVPVPAVGVAVADMSPVVPVPVSGLNP